MRIWISLFIAALRILTGGGAACRLPAVPADLVRVLPDFAEVLFLLLPIFADALLVIPPDILFTFPVVFFLSVDATG